jgi:hypothetical protein
MPNPNPKTDHLTPWKPGQSGNPSGMTSEQAAKRKANRDKAFALEEKMLAALEADMTADESKILGHIRADVLRLIHTAIEREDGKPVARNELSSPDGTMTPPSTVQIIAVEAEKDVDSDGE